MRLGLADNELTEETVGLGLEAAVAGPGRSNDHERWILAAINNPDPLVDSRFERPPTRAKFSREFV